VKETDLAWTTITYAMGEKEKTDRMVCLGAGAFIPFAAGIVFSEQFLAQPHMVKGLYMAHVVLVVVTAAAALRCIQAVGMSRGLMALETAHVGYAEASDGERAGRLLSAAAKFTGRASYFRRVYGASAAMALLLGVAAYILASFGDLL
jgi:hypothetical protein